MERTGLRHWHLLIPDPGKPPLKQVFTTTPLDDVVQVVAVPLLLHRAGNSAGTARYLGTCGSVFMTPIPFRPLRSAAPTQSVKRVGSGSRGALKMHLPLNPDQPDLRHGASPAVA
jgi:hypothetical protein